MEKYMNCRDWFRALTRTMVLLVLSTVADAEPNLRILTSMTEQVYEPYVAAFRARNPGVDVLVLNKNTNFAVGEIALGNQRGFDIFWASSPEAFELLSESGHLSTLDGVPYRGFALSSVGWSWREDRLTGPAPTQWNDLLDGRFAGQIGIARPSRSGTTHMLVEQILQNRGWDNGWAYLLELSANLATITSRSFGVIDGLKSSRFLLGLNIDFLALSEAGNGLKFRYARPVTLATARIAKLENSTSPELADRFIRFVGSEEGQRLLLTPSIRRVPVDPGVRAQVDYSDFPALEAALQFSWTHYDPKLAADRYWAVNALFDQFITLQLNQRRELWRKLRVLEARQDPAMRADLAKVRQLLTRMPVPEAEAMAEKLRVAPGPGSLYATLLPIQKQAINEWGDLALEWLEAAATRLGHHE
ncbi:ABC transporter substrate-binding protein [Marinobacter sp. X15-166B]|uniref:ABC transporter substrate-binding protein n=1 Tax=Marinobacter sp. X15-166B TaxID=1897620 RepID=UPI00085CA733|nr:ABC transporter substrate-binding protein [Marinobacter sp. X15-166B]OEY67040.1 hypothetical protein BG841_11625 [Marinobacter sp. X15-166B]